MAAARFGCTNRVVANPAAGDPATIWEGLPPFGESAQIMKYYFRCGLVCFAITVLGVGRWLWHTGQTMADVSPAMWSLFILAPVLATIVVGTFAAGAKVPWSWNKTILFSFVGWMLTFGVFIGAGAAYLWQQNRRSEMSLDQSMTLHANAAVERARKDFGVTLDYSTDSLVELERILEQLHQRNVANAFDEATLGSESQLWGAYIGGVFKKITPAEWQRDSAAAGPGSFPLKIKATEFFPCGWVWKRIRNGKEDNTMQKFEIALRSLNRGVAAVTNDPGVTVLKP